jgi:histidine triad (HIT) family protein
MSDCVFCDIIDGRGEATYVWKDDLVAAILDIRPVNAGHICVIPNAHFPYLADLPEETGAQMFRVAQRLARALYRSGLPCEGVNLFLADGEVAMQEVFHAHLHVFPRVRGDGFGLTFGADNFTRPTRAELEEVGKKIRQAVDQLPRDEK